MPESITGSGKHVSHLEIEAAAARLGVEPSELADLTDTTRDPTLAHLASCEQCRRQLVPDTESSAAILATLAEVHSQPAFPHSDEDERILETLTDHGMARLRTSSATVTTVRRMGRF